MKRLGLVVVLLLAGCTTEHAARSERPTAQTTRRAMAAVPDMPAQPSPVVKVPSSGTGRLAAAEAGHYMDAQETDLRQRLRASGVAVRRMGDSIMLSIGNDILFETGSAELSARAGQIVAAMGSVLAHYNKTSVEVAGYSDTTGSPEFNLKLSQARAQSVAARLIDRGVDRARVTPQGYGETHLKIPTGDQVNEPRNRRVEIRIVPSVQT